MKVKIEIVKTHQRFFQHLKYEIFRLKKRHDVQAIWQKNEYIHAWLCSTTPIFQMFVQRY